MDKEVDIKLAIVTVTVASIAGQHIERIKVETQYGADIYYTPKFGEDDTPQNRLAQAAVELASQTWSQE
jgi:hypothetical protein